MEGRVDRTKLYGFNGRSRRPQIELARKLGITEYMQPAGGCCFLTDESYSRKLRDLIENMEAQALSMDDVYMLGVGRHFRLGADLKVVVGRDETENNFLDYYTRTHLSAQAVDFPGPTAIVMGTMGEDLVERVASVVARYCDGKRESSVSVEFRTNGDTRVVVVAPARDELIEQLRI
jgi:putative lipoic acid-binding regulatory protein